ncbi:MAG: hypothetical protein II721_06860, partial [Bacilli bacterium]|nr:hypothetical protein [Bacilli bacterium]
MDIKKKSLPIMLLALSLAACGGGTPASSSSSSATSSSSGVASTSETSSSEEKESSKDYEDSSAADSSYEEGESSKSEESSSTEASSNKEEGEWDDNTAGLFEDHLHGVVLPYIDFVDYEAVYDDYFDEIFITGDGVEEGDIENYSYLFLEEDGWKGGDISKVHGFEEGTIFSFLRSVTTEEGTRYVYCVFYAVDYDETTDESTIAKKGSLHLEAYDPYYYEWPSDAAEHIANLVYDFTLVEEPTVLPAFEGADYYSISLDNMAIYCYLESDGSEDLGYGEILEEAGWTIEEERDGYGYFVAVSPNLDYQVAYLYDEDYGDLDIYLESYEVPLTAYDSWQQDIIDGFFAIYENDGYAYSIPPIEIEGGEYYFYEDKENFYAYIFDEYEFVLGHVDVYNATSDDFASYLKTLVADGWDENPNDSGVVLLEKTFENRTAHMSLEFKEDEGALCLTFGLIPTVNPYSEWPADVIEAELDRLTDGATYTPLPAYEGPHNGFKVNGNVIQILLGEGIEAETVVNSYAKTLLTAEFTFDEDKLYYFDPTGSYFVSFTVMDDCVELYIGQPEVPLPTY